MLLGFKYMETFEKLYTYSSNLHSETWLWTSFWKVCEKYVSLLIWTEMQYRHPSEIL